jgi:hypothetical protein
LSIKEFFHSLFTLLAPLFYAPGATNLWYWRHFFMLLAPPLRSWRHSHYGVAFGFRLILRVKRSQRDSRCLP